MSTLKDELINNTEYAGDIYIKRIHNNYLSTILQCLISKDTTYENFKYKDKVTKSKIYDAVYKEMKKYQIINNEYKEMISDDALTEGTKVRFIIEIFDRDGYLERYKNNENYPLFVLSREVLNKRVKGIAVYSSKDIFSVERECYA